MRIILVLLKSKKYMESSNSSFYFLTATKENTENLIMNLDNKKAVKFTDIPTKLVKKFG